MSQLDGCAVVWPHGVCEAVPVLQLHVLVPFVFPVTPDGSVVDVPEGGYGSVELLACDLTHVLAQRMGV